MRCQVAGVMKSSQVKLYKSEGGKEDIGMVHKCAELGQMKYSKSLHEPLPGTCNMPTALWCMQTSRTDGSEECCSASKGQVCLGHL